MNAITKENEDATLPVVVLPHWDGSGDSMEVVSVLDWLQEVAKFFNSWGCWQDEVVDVKANKLDDALWAVGHLLEDHYLNDGEFVAAALRRVPAWAELPKLVPTSKCLREITELLEYLEKLLPVGCSFIFISHLLSPLADVWDECWTSPTVVSERPVFV